MTVEEKAGMYAAKTEADFGFDMHPKTASFQGFIAGYAEAMRWRDPKVELPESQEIVLVKSDNGCYATAYCHGASGCFIDYGSDAYVDFGEIIGWRPIE